MKCPHYKLSSCKPPRCPVSLPIFSVSQKRRLPTVANVDSHRFLTTYKAWAVKMEPTEWKQQSPERQRSAGKPAESCQSRQGPRIMQGKRLQCKNSFHPPPHTHTHPSGADRGCADFPTHLAPIHSSRARALGGYA